MAMEDVRRFLAALDADDDLAVRAVAGLKGVAEGAGYDFSADELRAALDGAAGGLGDGELDRVVGGALHLTVDVGIPGSQSLTPGDYGHGDLGQPGTLRFASFSKTGFGR